VIGFQQRWLILWDILDGVPAVFAKVVWRDRAISGNRRATTGTEMIDPVLVEQLADAAWPAAEQVALGPWKLRATHGVTRRANSVFTAGREEARGDELARWVEEAERFYAMRSLPAVFQISAATGAKELDALLARRGYAMNAPSQVWSISRSAISRQRPRADDSWTIRREDQPDEGWFNCAFDEPPARRRVHEQIVRRVPPPRLYVAAMMEGMVAGCGMATSARGHTGIFCMATHAAYRRRGIALTLVTELCEWCRGLGDERAFLQVMADNEAAKGLYRRVGFGFEYGYHYRVK
jgi:N-acetylglutamate synthase